MATGTFAEKHNKITAKITQPNDNRYWVNTILFSFVLVFLLAAYQTVKGIRLDVYQLNIVFSFTGMYLIGLSFALSGLTYFWNFVDTKVVYRKYLGLVGFYYVFSHSLFSLVNYLLIPSAPQPSFDLEYNWRVGEMLISNSWAFLSALVSLGIFAYMTIISNKYSMLELGGLIWRKQLRYLGYFAYALIVIHFGLKRFDVWTNWLSEPNGLPPHSLILIVFVFLVFVLRIALYFHQKRKKSI